MDNIKPPALIEQAKKAPGLYLVKARHIFFIRVNQAGEVHQVNPSSLKSEEFLCDDGWSVEAYVPGFLRIFRLEEILP